MKTPEEITLPLRAANAEGGASRISGDVAALLPGQTVLEYRIEKMLGGGGFGITYLAHDINLELPVAVKEYFPGDLAVRLADRSVHVRSAENAARFQWGLERFLDEARALASFRHPNIVRVLRYFKENGTAYIVMEYESGDPLKHWLARQPSLGRNGLLQIVYPLMDGLEAVHKLNFLHRDIKPDNIYIRADGTPVLLDFGAARRVTGNHDMTNIVSPGFAPFEQYHSKGNQGPWTDLYSLGAVMYWITTGNKPMESASRVREDAMPKAADTASILVFGEPLLRAIDWALSPDEARRPQTVAALRRALSNSEHIKTQTVRKNVLGTIMFLDLVAYSTYSVDQQVVSKALFNELITKAIGGVKESSRIMIDTDDGAAICFLGDPEEALQSALLLRDLLLQKYGKKLSLRAGLHLGPIRMVFDINHRVNVVGDGINVAQRIMDFSKANQIVVSRAYYDVISRITDSAAGLFGYLGPHMDKHLRTHDIYAVLDPDATPQAPVIHNTGFEHTASLAALASLTPEMVLGIETELARAIGPLARVLVKKALPRSVSAQGLRDRLAVSIPDAAVREAFVRPKSTRVPSNSAPHPASGLRSSGHALSQPVTIPIPSVSRSGVSQPATMPSTPIQVHNFSAEQQALLERALSQLIGPLSKTLVRKEAARQPTFSAQLQALALHIDKPDDRARFLAAAQKLQNGR
ncbi:MAG: protein kinase domain-containing protein [Polaromonas sp.]